MGWYRYDTQTTLLQSADDVYYVSLGFGIRMPRIG